MTSTLSLPISTNINVVASISTDKTSPYYTKKNLNEEAGSFLTQATMLVYDDILRFQDATPRSNILATIITPKQKTSIYGAIKRICQPMYGVSTSQYYDETYFNLLKGYIGSYFYKKYDWFNTNEKLNIFEFAALNLGNIPYQIGDIFVEGESIREAYTDYAEQAMGVFKAWQDSHGENAFIVRDELKGKIVELQLYNETLHEDGSSTQLENGPIVWVGFNDNGNIVVYDVDPALPTGKTADMSNFRYDTFEGNILWFMDELVGMESDWRQNAKPDPTPSNPNPTAYGYVQLTEPAVTTKAISLYKQKLARFNARKNSRNWKPFGIPAGTEIPIPSWLSLMEKTVINGSYKHISQMNILSYDEMLALALVHMHYGKVTKDADWVELETGSVEAAKRIYLRDHHSAVGGATDQDTLDRLNTDRGGFFQIHYKQAPSITAKVMEYTPVGVAATAILEQIKKSRYQGVIDTVKSWFGW